MQGSTTAPGWAWVEPHREEAALEATRLSDFVANTLQAEARNLLLSMSLLNHSWHACHFQVV